MLTVCGILFYFMVVGWVLYSSEKQRRRFHEKRHEYWHSEAKSLRQALVKNNTRVDGDEWKDICGY